MPCTSPAYNNVSKYVLVIKMYLPYRCVIILLYGQYMFLFSCVLVDILHTGHQWSGWGHEVHVGDQHTIIPAKDTFVYHQKKDYLLSYFSRVLSKIKCAGKNAFFKSYILH